MKTDEKIKMFNDVFAPKSGEKILFLVDIPHDEIKDNKKWKDRRKMAEEWYQLFNKMGEKNDFSVNILYYNATGMHNAPIPKKIINEVKKVNLVICISEYSATTSLGPIILAKNSKIRGASMPTVEKRMENTAFKADYKKVKRYADAIQKMLDNSIGAEINFSTGDKLYLDLRNRSGFTDSGDCTKNGNFINFPSGEACISPYEAVSEELKNYNQSKTEGIMPVFYDEEILKFKIKNNKIIEILGKGKKSEEMKIFFNENETRKNIAELGIGCNPKAVITGNILEDEKVGLHIAYGTSMHIGGKIQSDMHQDICYPKGCPIEGTTVTLISKDNSKTVLIKDAQLQYNLFQ